MEFLKKNLKIIITSVIFIAAIIVLGIYNIECVQAIEAKRSSYTRTEFDYKLSILDETQLSSIEDSDTVESVYPYHLFTNLFPKSKKTVAFVSAPEYKKSERIGFLGDKTLIKGSFDGEGAVIDEAAATELGVKIGDEISFAWGEEQLTQKVKGICLSYSYDLKDYRYGLVLLDYTSEMQAAYDIKTATIPYTGAFVKAASDGCYAFLKRALGLEDVEDKAEHYEINAKSKTDKLEKQVISINIGAAFGIAIFYSALSVLFILINKRSDEAERDGGLTKKKMFGAYLAGGSVCAAAVAAITFVVLLIFGITTHFIAEAIGTVLALSLPALVAIPAVYITAKIYTDRLYANRSKEVGSSSLRG